MIHDGVRWAVVEMETLDVSQSGHYCTELDALVCRLLPNVIVRSQSLNTGKMSFVRAMIRKYRFPQVLLEGTIESRPNRFIMNVDMGGRVVKCHCPVTGRIGNLVFDQIPCLLSENDSPGRKTRFTVEAISLDPIDKENKIWVGVNQTKANDYVDHFIRVGALSTMLRDVGEVEREVRQGDSRIDFLVNRTVFVEVKTPLFDLPCEGHPSCRARHGPLLSFDRMIRHFGDVSRTIAKGRRGILLLCYLYDAKPFQVPRQNSKTVRIQKAARAASSRGLENWQLNLHIDEHGVEFVRCFKLELF
jgi:sugar fermentation stimulation protein A